MREAPETSAGLGNSQGFRAREITVQILTLLLIIYVFQKKSHPLSRPVSLAINWGQRILACTLAMRVK